MTHLFKRLHVTLFFALITFQSNAQLSSSELAYSTQGDSLTENYTLWLTATFNDITDVGGVQISAYDAETGVFIQEYQATRDELIASGFLTGEHLYFQLLDISEERQYRIQMNAYNLEGAFIEIEELITTL